MFVLGSQALLADSVKPTWINKSPNWSEVFFFFFFFFSFDHLAADPKWSKQGTTLWPSCLKMYLTAFVMHWQHIAEDLRPMGSVLSKYNMPFYFNPRKFQSPGSTKICFYAFFKSLFIKAHPLPYSLTNSTNSSIERKRNWYSSPKYSSFGILSFTELPWGKLKSIRTLRSTESFFSVVFKGEITISDLNGL